MPPPFESSSSFLLRVGVGSLIFLLILLMDGERDLETDPSLWLCLSVALRTNSLVFSFKRIGLMFLELLNSKTLLLKPSRFTSSLSCIFLRVRCLMIWQITSLFIWIYWLSVCSLRRPRLPSLSFMPAFTSTERSKLDSVRLMLTEGPDASMHF